MPQKNPLIEETQRRLAHLKTMPATDSRRREILALERVLILAPKQAADATKSRRIVRQRERAVEEDDDQEDEDKIPLRRVEHTEGRKKVILHTPKKEEPETESERKADERERKERLENTLSLVGLTHRGMS
jgi:hypothetical protein